MWLCHHSIDGYCELTLEYKPKKTDSKTKHKFKSLNPES
jgi:hypothetical protein